MAELEPSRLFSFLDDKENYVFTFLEGQRVMADSAVLLGYSPYDLAFFRVAFLCTTHVIQFFKNNESLGFYIDAEDPAFHFKLEANSQGYVRALKVPEEARLISERITGLVRFVKMAPYQREPYQSVIQVQKQSLDAIINQILEQSYQIAAQVYVSQNSDQSIMVSKLPVKDPDHPVLQPKEYLMQNKKQFLSILNKALNRETDVISAFEDLGYKYLSSTEIRLHCPCSKENILVSLASLLRSEMEIAESQGRSELEITCQYCKKMYTITRDDMKTISIN